jgi:hypothetical protein
MLLRVWQAAATRASALIACPRGRIHVEGVDS